MDTFMIYNGLLYSKTNEQTKTIPCNIDESHKYNPLWKNKDPKEYMIFFSLYNVHKQAKQTTYFRDNICWCWNI